MQSFLGGDVIWMLFGASVVLTTLIAAVRAVQRWFRLRRVLAVRLARSVDDVADGEVVLLRGRASGANVRGPVSGKEALWSRVTVRAEVLRPGWLSYTNVLTETVGESLVLDEVTIPMKGATVVVSDDRVERSYTPEEGTFEPHVLEFVKSRAELHELLGDDKLARVAVRTREENIVAGDEINLLGRVRKEADRVRVEPGPDGLYVSHADIRELARTGALWFSALSAACLALSLTGCKDEVKEKSESVTLLRAVERYRQSENVFRPAAAEELAKTPCTCSDVCEAKNACVAASEPTAKALLMTREVEHGLTEVQDGKLSPSDPRALAFEGKLDEASKLIEQGQNALSGCDEKLMGLKRRYGL